jgi:glutathione S-transferase
VAAGKNILYDVPVSNNGARNRLIIYWKGLEDQFAITNPSEIDGIKSPRYLAMNPQGKMPLLVTADGLALPESEVISQYICHAFAENSGPELIPEDPETRAICALATRIHDLYVVPIQGCMYRAGYDVKTRADQLAEVVKQLDVIEGVMNLRTDGPFVGGREPSTADAALFPTYVFIEYILPKHFGWTDVWAGRPTTAKWFEAMKLDTCGARVYGEVRGGLEAWEENGRWDTVGVTEAVKDTSFKWAY